MNKSKLIIILFAFYANNFFTSGSFAFSEESFFAQTSTDSQISPGQKLTINDVDPVNFKRVAFIHILNKVTTKTTKLRLNVGAKTKFGSLEIIAHKCWAAPASEKPENKILIEVAQNNKEKAERLFLGWIFSSSQSISVFEHPIYDITALDCID